jgi:hypothetical protein
MISECPTSPVSWSKGHTSAVVLHPDALLGGEGNFGKQDLVQGSKSLGASH